MVPRDSPQSEGICPAVRTTRPEECPVVGNWKRTQRACPLKQPVSEGHFNLQGFSFLFSFFKACEKMLNMAHDSVQSLRRVRLFATPWTAARQASLSITNSRSLLKLMSIKSVMPSNHLILYRPLLLPQSFSASGSFPMSQYFASGGQSIGASASVSVLPMNIQD